MSRPSICTKKLLTEEHEAWHFPQKWDELYCAIHGTTTSPRGRKLELKRFFKWLPEMDPGKPHHPRMTEEECKQDVVAHESVYCHALHEVLKRRDRGWAYVGGELTIYAPRMPPLEVILETACDGLKMKFINPDTGLTIVQEK